MIRSILSGTRLRKAMIMTVAVLAGAALLAPRALAAIPQSTTGVITATTISATQWSSGNITLMSRTGGVRNVAMFQPGAALPAGSWTLSAAVLIANGLATPLTFRCWLQVRTTEGFINGVANDWGGLGNGWHQTMTFP